MTAPESEPSAADAYVSAPPEVPTAEPRSEAWAATADDTELPDDAPADMKTVRKLRHEAAGLRIQLKEAKAAAAQLEGATARLAALERAEIERVAAEQLIDAGDVWRVPDDVQQSWYDEKFQQLQPDKVRESIEALIQQKPHLARAATPPPTQRPIEGLRAGASPEPKQTAITWNQALRRHGV